MKENIIENIELIFRLLVQEKLSLGSDFGQSYSGNQDNICQEKLGTAFLLLEYYAYTKDVEVLDTLLASVKTLSFYCKSRNTNNYTLYYGRMGMVFLYTEMCRLLQNEVYLQEALDIARQHITGNSFHFMMLGNSSLHKGIAGILLCLVKLHKACGEKWLLPVIEVYVNKLLSNGIFAPQGIRWAGISQRNSERIGLDTGTSGIAFVLIEIGRYFNNKYFTELGMQALLYEDTYHEEITKCNANMNYTNCVYSGSMGAALVRLYADSVQNEKKYTKHWEDGIKQITNLLHDEKLSANKTSQLANVGLLLDSAYEITGNKYYYLLMEEVILKILSQQKIMNGGWRDGIIGVGYFLARFLNSNEVNPLTSLLLPVDRNVPDEPKISLNLESVLLAGKLELYDKYFADALKFSWPIIKERFSSVLITYFSTSNLPSLDSMCSVLNETSVTSKDSTICNDLKDALEKDVFFLDIRRQLSHYNISCNEEENVAQMLRILKKDEADFMNCRFIWSKDVWIFDRDPYIDFSKQLKYTEVVNLFSIYGEHSFVCVLTQFDTLQVEKLAIDKLICDRFLEPCTVNEAYTAIAKFLLGQEKEIVELIRFQFNTDNDAQILKVLKKMVTESVKYYFSEGILCIAHTQSLNHNINQLNHESIER